MVHHKHTNFRAGSSFPEFNDGDVKVSITGSREYQLHSGVLRNASPVMRQLLDEENAAKLSKRATTHLLYRIVLCRNPDYEEGSTEISHILEDVPLDSMGRPVPGAPTGVGLELENGRRLPPIFSAYDAVLGAMYNQPIYLGDAQEDGLADLLSNAFQITVVAEHLDCIRIVSRPIEATLLATGQSLYKAIANNPVPWLTFAARVKSRAIFKEALIHSAGRWNQPDVRQMVLDGQIPEHVLQVLARKGEAVKQNVSQASRYLASYYPAMLLREVHPNDKEKTSRASYGNDIMMWMALAVFRHFVSDCMATDLTHHAPDLGWGFINAITLGGEEYLGRKTLQGNFHTRFPMTGKGMACIEHRLGEIKDDVKQWAMPLKINQSALDVGQHPVEHFVHINVLTKDYPWVSDELATDENESAETDEPREQSEQEDEEASNSDENEAMEDVQGAPFEDSDDCSDDYIEQPPKPLHLGSTVHESDTEYDDEEEEEEEEHQQMVQTSRKAVLQEQKNGKKKSKQPQQSRNRH